jgi:hypothetical protein
MLSADDFARVSEYMDGVGRTVVVWRRGRGGKLLILRLTRDGAAAARADHLGAQFVEDHLPGAVLATLGPRGEGSPGVVTWGGRHGAHG